MVKTTSGIKGIFCISLDFEKYWGFHDIYNPEDISHFQGVGMIVSGLLDLFTRHDIHVTWATVGLLGFEALEEQQKFSAELSIPYSNPNYSPFPLEKNHKEGLSNQLFLGKEEIKMIAATKNQELGSHTFSHFYCCESGPTSKDFEQDTQNMVRVAEQFGLSISSIVFPRNQVNEDCLKISAEAGFTAYRGNQPNRFWKNSTYENESKLKKTGRFLDAYFPLSKTDFLNIDDLKNQKSDCLNIPASRFLRPNSNNAFLEKRKLKRIKKEMLYAAQNNHIYHLWWHPHNFLKNPAESLNQLDEILRFYKELNNKYGFSSLNMGEIAQYVKA